MDLTKSDQYQQDQDAQLQPERQQFLDDTDLCRNFQYFMRHPTLVLTREMIAERVWGYFFDSFINIS